MTKRALSFLLLAAVTLVYASCKKQSEDLSQYGSDITRAYYPFTLGHWIDYDVDSTVWNDFDCTKKTRSLKMRYIVSDTFTDNQGRASYQVDVLQRSSDTALWQTSQVFYLTPSVSGIEVVMQNLRFQKMIFPVADGRVWLGNHAIDTTDADLRQYGGWVYKYSNFIQTYDNGRVKYDNTVTVDEVNSTINDPDASPNAYAEKIFSREVYALNVGMVYRENTMWTYDPGTAATACRKGFQVVMRATNHN